MGELEAKLKSVAGCFPILVVTDGVFSMEGDLAKLPEIVGLAKRYGAIVVVDDSHGTGVMGETGRGTVEHYGLTGEVDVITGTLGKALGGAAGGFVAGSSALIDTLIQRSRPQLFSNALPATVACSSLAAIDYLETHPELVRDLRDKTRYFRVALERIGYKPLITESAIVPIIVGETAFAIAISDKLLKTGVFVTGFGYPVVPEGTARIRVQISAALTKDEMDRALAAFEQVGRETRLALKFTRSGIVLKPSATLGRMGTLNPACARLRDNALELYPRMVAPGNISRIGSFRANERSDGSLELEFRGFALEPEAPYELRDGSGGYGCEDPRVTFVAAIDRYVMAYVAFGPRGPEVAVAISEDGLLWTRLGLLQFQGSDEPFADKDAAIFPEPVISPSGIESLAFYHRPTLQLSGNAKQTLLAIEALPPSRREGISIAYVPLAAIRADINALCVATETHRLECRRRTGEPSR